jgi:hypothetical protein
MKTGYGGGFLVVVMVLLAPLAGIVVWEVLQRHRFTAEAERVDAVLEKFQMHACVVGKDGNPLPTASGRTDFPYLVFTRVNASDSWDLRDRRWMLGADFVDEDGCWHAFRVNVYLVQNRRILLRSPEFQMFRDNPTQLALEAEFDKAVSEFTRTDVVAK